MTSLLLIISFIIHFITLTIVVQLFKQFQELKSKEKDNTAELFDGYLREIKAENKKLQKELAINTSPETNSKNISAPYHENKGNKGVSKKDPKKESNTAYTPPIDNASEESFTPSLQGKILNLHKDGASATDIARQLDCGKTEVSLTIQLYEKNSQ